MSDEQRALAPRHVFRTSPLAPALGTFGIVLSVASLRLMGTHPLIPGRVPLVVIVVISLLCTVSLVHVQFRKQSLSLTLAEIPVVIGLFLVSPVVLVVVRGAVPLLWDLVRRRPLEKSWFNVGLNSSSTVAAIAVVRLVDGPTTGPAAWAVAALAAIVAALVEQVAVGVIVYLTDPRFDIGTYVRATVACLVVTLVATAMGLVALVAMLQDVRSVWILVALIALASGQLRSFGQLRDRTQNLEQLYDFTRTIGAAPTVLEVVGHALRESSRLLRAGGAELLLPVAGGWERLVLTEDDGTVARTPGTAPASWLPVAPGSAVLVAGTTPAQAEWLAERGWPKALVAPVRGGEGAVALLVVGDRLGDVRGFDDTDAGVLATLAAHVGTALTNGRLIDRLQHASTHDRLTGLANRLMLEQTLVHMQESQTPLALLVLDLDGFKDVNDTLGHLHGDQLLIMVARRLEQAVTHIPGAVVARLGGDEFALVLPGMDGVHGTAAGRAAVAAIEQPVQLEESLFDISASVGVATLPADGPDPEALLRRADVAMYAAKGAADGVRRYQPAMDQHTPQRLALARELREALALGELVVHVQPQVDIATRRVIGTEALVRWQHPARGLVYPDEFIPTAERSGLMRALTTEVLDKSVAAAAQWFREGHPLTIAVNISARSVLDPTLPGEVERTLQRHGLPPHLLTLEITESSVITEPAKAREMLARIHSQGVRISIDDFGTGYSSLSYLHTLTVDEIKIDRSFVMAMAAGGSTVIVRSIVDLARNLGLACVAEGVETTDNYDTLADVGCSTAQGYLISRPMPADVFLPWLRTSAWAGPAPADADTLALDTTTPLPRKP